MKNEIFSLAHLRVLGATALISTIAMASMLIWVLMSWYLVKTCMALSCGNSIIDPLALIANVIVPICLCINLFCLAIILWKKGQLGVVAIITIILFIATTIGVVLSGVAFCSEVLENSITFPSLVWWLM